MGVNEPQQPAEFLPHVMLNSIQHAIREKGPPIGV